jgi:uncharacterized membrane protein YjjP (DUF1212 family)
MVSTEYVSALAIVLVGVLKVFGIEIGNDVITALLIAGLGLFNAIRRYKKGDINIGGVRKV